MKRVLLNADDFGLAPAINEAVLIAAHAGLIRSTSLSVNHCAAEPAGHVAAALPDLGVGLHITLVEEHPVVAPAEVPTLADHRGLLPKSGSLFAARWAAGRISAKDVRREVAAQWDRLEDFGICATHFDSHDHVHVLPGIFELCLDEAARRGVRRVRIPLEASAPEPVGLRRRCENVALSRFARRAARVATARGFTFPDSFMGFFGAGQLDASALERRVRLCGSGTTEIAMHPAMRNPPRDDMAGWGYNWRAEFDALRSPLVRGAFDDSTATLTGYSDLESARPFAEPPDGWRSRSRRRRADSGSCPGGRVRGCWSMRRSQRTDRRPRV